MCYWGWQCSPQEPQTKKTILVFQLRCRCLFIAFCIKKCHLLCSSGLFTTSMDYIISQNRSLLKTMNHGKKNQKLFFLLKSHTMKRLIKLQRSTSHFSGKYPKGAAPISMHFCIRISSIVFKTATQDLLTETTKNNHQ